jgi:hypothetical protein
MASLSFQDVAIPSAVLWDGAIMLIPLFAVTEISIDSTFHLPPIGSSGMRAISPVHDDTVRLRGLLVGPSRYALKLMLEMQAEAGQRGSAASAIVGAIGGAVGAPGLGVTGLILVTAMTIRTDMQVKQLSFSANAGRRQVLDVSITLEHLPRPSAASKLLDLASVGVGALMDATA